MGMIKTCQLSVEIIQLLNGSTSSRVLVNGMRREAAQHNQRSLTAVKPDHFYAHIAGLHGDIANDNGDYFEWRDTLLTKIPEGIYAFETWRQKPNLINHDKGLRVGTIIDVWPIFSEKAIDFLCETSKRDAKKRDPILAMALEQGRTVSASMGVWVAHSFCSICDNRAETEEQWCDHLKYHKGRKDPQSGKLVYENNKEINGMELSWITVGAPADRDATLRKIVACNSIIDKLVEGE